MIQGGHVYRASVFYFFALLLLALAGFWPSYIAPKRYETDWHVHLHGVAMFLWVVLLVAQSGLIRAKANAVHRQLGKASYALVPAIVVSTLLLAHYRMRQGIDAQLLYFFYVQLSLLAVFVLSFALAIANRRTPALHMRFMVCAALTLVDPILARVFFFGAGIEPPLLQFLTYGIVDVILAALIAHDLKQSHRARVYPAMLAVFVASQAPTFFVFQTPAWRGFTEAFARLPLP